MRSIATQVKLKRLQKAGKRVSMFKAKAKKNLFYTMCRYIHWTMKNGGGLIKIYKPDGSFDMFMIGLKTDLAQHS